MTKLELHKEICDAIHILYVKKNHDYGDSFHDTWVEEGYAMARIRLTDKLNRFKTLSKLVSASDQKVTDESLRDTLMDLANYAIMTILEMDLDSATKEEPKEYLTPVKGQLSPPLRYDDCCRDLDGSLATMDLWN